MMGKDINKRYFYSSMSQVQATLNNWLIRGRIMTASHFMQSDGSILFYC